MIALEKGAEPPTLVANGAAWEAHLIAIQVAGDSPTQADLNRYNQPDVKEALLVETREKCAYCESKFRHVAPGDIEHIVPKRLGPQWRYRWENLTIACSNCNTYKGVYEDLVDPYVDDPEEVFELVGPMILGVHTSEKAQVTETVLRLNRRELIDKRVERIKSLHRMFCHAQTLTNPAYRDAMLADLRDRETGADQEYTAISRAFVAGLIARGLISPV